MTNIIASRNKREGFYYGKMWERQLAGLLSNGQIIWYKHTTKHKRVKDSNVSLKAYAKKRGDYASSKL